MRETAMTKREASNGFTLVEMILTIVILAIALVSIAGMVSLGISNSANTLIEARATALAESYLDEVMGRRFDERSAASGRSPCFTLGGGRPCSTTMGPDGGETSRDRYDDVDDYHNFSEGDGVPGQPIADAEGNTRSEYENFNIGITVAYAGADFGLDATYAKLITVTVTTRDMAEGWQFSVYKGNY
jgi:MSHA pilin protein MshD